VAAERVIAEIRAQTEKKGSGKVCQVAAYTDRRSARALANRLMDDGFDSYVSHTYHNERDRYRVRVRPQAGRTIKAVASDLKRKGLSVWVTNE
jgi:cell division septation protein DedD